jgi:hypothetical protein
MRVRGGEPGGSRLFYVDTGPRWVYMLPASEVFDLRVAPPVRPTPLRLREKSPLPSAYFDRLAARDESRPSPVEERK